MRFSHKCEYELGLAVRGSLSKIFAPFFFLSHDFSNQEPNYISVLLVISEKGYFDMPKQQKPR